MKQVTDEVSDKIWKWIWNSTLPEETDKDLLNEHSLFCKMYKEGKENEYPLNKMNL